jgi:hypothetical protein
MDASERQNKDAKPGQTLAHTRGVDPEENLRLEVLRQQKELERKLRERAVWRKASNVPSIVREDGSSRERTPACTLPSRTEQKLSGFFQRIRFGRLLEK